MISVTIPIPPSVNALYIRGRTKSPKYRQWIEDAGWQVRAQLASSKRKGVAGKYSFKLLLPEKARIDCDNGVKAAMDLLQNLGVTPNDRHCRRQSSEFSPHVLPGQAVIVVEEIAA